MLKKRNLDPSLQQWIANQGIGPGIGDVKYLASALSATSKFRNNLNNLNVSGADMATLFPAAKALMTSYQNDVLVAFPGSYEEVATTDWDHYDTHILGTSQIPLQPRIDLVQTTNAFSPGWTLSGRGNIWKNLTFRHGTAEADYIGLEVSGRYNLLENIYMMSPMIQAQADHADYEGVRVSGHNNYFKRCRFGSDGMMRDAANFCVNVYGGIGNKFDQCYFVAGIDDSDPSFMYMDNDIRDMRDCYLKECTFLAYAANIGSTMTYALKNSHGANTLFVIVERCNFINVTYLSDAADDNWIWVDTAGDTAAAAATGIAVRGLGT